MTMRTLAAATVVAYVLAACGGGGGAGNTTSSTQNTGTTQSTSTSQPAAASGDGTSSQSVATATTLVGSNGDLSKYLGTWKSGCEVRGGFTNATASVSSPASDPASASPAVPADTSVSAGGTSVASTSAPAPTPSPAASPAVLSTTGSITFYYGVSAITFTSVNGNTLAAQSTDKFYEDSGCTKPMSNPYEGTQSLTLTYLGNAELTPNENFLGSADNVSINIAGSDKAETGYLGFDPSYGKFYTSASTSFSQDSSPLIKQ